MGLVLIKFILPAITGATFAIPLTVCAKKNLKCQAFLFGFTTFFQVFHHLCETPGLSLLFCLMGENLLRYFATYGLVMSIFNTILLLSDLDNDSRNCVSTCVGLVTAVRIFQSVDGYGVFSAPLTISLFIVASTWGKEMWKTKSIHPDKDKWIKCILPGFTLGTISFLLRFLLENGWNYMVVHSLHHVFLAASLSVLLRIAKNGSGSSTCPSSPLSCCCCTGCCGC